jgi:hypothetical protein
VNLKVGRTGRSIMRSDKRLARYHRAMDWTEHSTLVWAMDERRWIIIIDIGWRATRDRCPVAGRARPAVRAPGAGRLG